MKNLEYMEKHPCENIDYCYCKQTTDGKKTILYFDGKPDQIAYNDMDLNRSNGETFRTLLEDIETMDIHCIGCADCPWKYICDLMCEECDIDE